LEKETIFYSPWTKKFLKIVKEGCQSLIFHESKVFYEMPHYCKILKKIHSKSWKKKLFFLLSLKKKIIKNIKSGLPELEFS
jgi:hypothetical protein